jgi:hypothetical protein
MVAAVNDEVLIPLVAVTDVVDKPTAVTEPDVLSEVAVMSPTDRAPLDEMLPAVTPPTAETPAPDVRVPAAERPADPSTAPRTVSRPDEVR